MKSLINLWRRFVYWRNVDEFMLLRRDRNVRQLTRVAHPDEQPIGSSYIIPYCESIVTHIFHRGIDEFNDGRVYWCMGLQVRWIPKKEYYRRFGEIIEPDASHYHTPDRTMEGS